jgi:hypothetical protein
MYYTKLYLSQTIVVFMKNLIFVISTLLENLLQQSQPHIDEALSPPV